MSTFRAMSNCDLSFSTFIRIEITMNAFGSIFEETMAAIAKTGHFNVSHLSVLHAMILKFKGAFEDAKHHRRRSKNAR
ncbi:hypothetical protein [Herbaspirillum sp. RV1423]|uniref:hypothetical protein n=1 Tax=Herbaspirillum sp. RV1423 TaxID=1443993 RepID=UPI0018CC34E3|nr:hypothetical protein [Herbaspirillum sp. RV1423]